MNTGTTYKKGYNYKAEYEHYVAETEKYKDLWVKAETEVERLHDNLEKVEKLNDLLVDLSIVAHRIFTGKSVDIISDRLKYETLRDEVTKQLKEENE